MSRLLPHAAHWGAFLAETDGTRLLSARPFAGDPAPPAILGSLPEMVHSPLRISQPHIRQGWLRGDRAGGTPRGGEPFVPVGWDEATRLVAGEITRVRDRHGPASIFGGSYGWASAGRLHHAPTQLHRLLALAGGYTGQVGNYSYAAGMTLLPHIVGTLDPLQGPVVDWPAITAHARIMVLFGGLLPRNGQITPGGGGRHEMAERVRRAAAAGVRLVLVSPAGDDMPEGVACDWLPVRPGTDTALMLALMHVLDRDGLADHGFLDRCTVGADAVLAEARARTPDWAERVTGLPAARIEALAHDIAAQPTMLSATWSLQRAEFGEQPFHALIALAAMLGRIGQPGLGFGFGHGSMNGMGTPRRELASVVLPKPVNPAGSTIPVARITEMLEQPGGEYDFNGRRRRFPDTRLVYWAGGNPLHHHQDLNRLLRALARVETVVVHEPWWTAMARHADIVLPATTSLERDDIASSSRDRFILAMHQAVPPQGQARDDFAILADIAGHLGLAERFTEGRQPTDWLRLLYERARAAHAAQGGALPDFDRFWAQGSVEIPEPEQPAVPFAAFVADPMTHPLRTPSGRIELHSARIAGFGYDDCPGHPVWRAPREYLGSPLAERFPLHLLTPQPATRLHSQGDHAGISRGGKVGGRETITLNPVDATVRGLAAGDLVRVFNDRGACLASVRISGMLLRGVATLPTGAWLDPLTPGEPGSLCVHGNPNVLTQDVGTSRLSQGPSAQSCLVEVVRWRDAVPPPRSDKPPPITDT